ncbi:MAG: dephospho-CoA kinase [Nitrospirae bacterium CG02_land_8_20_14_3_00_44_33]|nr:dephospho-CoA kinase [Nitrospirota bacterium]OIO29690.1 MAG: dephospho-CoA kinase [Nitrospirae bacterium CG1_02_44_142]PIV40216.1 MAG: dephospho-CoA kinase [Nitrospirae bacterium CG02_land_8_20_14_3_00_44_33]
MYNNHMFIAGLTGNYGMGKSAVLQMFRELGAVTIDADWVVQQLLSEKQVLKKIKTLLGAGVFDKKGAPDKSKIAQRIFRNKSLRLKLECLLHPLVFERIDDFFRKTKNGSKVFIVEAPLIFERGYEGRFDKMITVFTKETTAINRLSLHGIPPKEVIERLKCQLPIKEKIKRSDYKIDNSGLPEKTKKQVEAVYRELLKEAKIKNLILEGRVDRAAKILGKPFSIEGTVIKGAGRGEKLLHTPTANISFKGYSPKEGVYAVRVSYSPIHRFTHSPLYDGVANIGKNPTFGASELSLEVHIFNFSGNLLGKKIKVHFIKHIRDEKEFPNAKALEAQIKRDIKKAKEILG